LIPTSVSVQDEFSIRRSIRRGCTAEAQNARIPQEVIEANNRWRRRERARSFTPGMWMMERYSVAIVSELTLIVFPRVYNLQTSTMDTQGHETNLYLRGLVEG